MRREPPGETASRMTQVAALLSRYLNEAARGARPIKRADLSTHQFLVVLAREYQPDGIDRDADAAGGLEATRRTLSQLAR